MIQLPDAADWATLGIETTTDADAVRRAYRTRLRDVGAEADPAGFQTLRAAYEKILAAVGDGPAARGGGAGEHVATVVATFLAELHARRAAGREDAAIALVDATLDAQQPGSAVSEAIEDALQEQLALSRNVSPGLFRHLADRLDWRDIQGRPARRDPERHALLLDRIAAEDWYHALRGAGDAAGRRIDALMTFERDRAAAALQRAPIDASERQHVRERFQQLLSHATFVLGRFDGGTLALLREAVEGPPLLGDTAAPAPASTGGPAAATLALSPQRRRWVRAAVLVAICVGIAGQLIYSRLPHRGTDTALPVEVALPLLKDPGTAWVDLVPGPDGVKVDWAPVMRLRHAIKELHTGYNEEAPTTLFTLPEADVPIGFLAPPELRKIAMRIQYSDGTWSEVRRYDIQKARP